MVDENSTLSLSFNSCWIKTRSLTRNSIFRLCWLCWLCCVYSPAVPLYSSRHLRLDWFLFCIDRSTLSSIFKRNCEPANGWIEKKLHLSIWPSSRQENMNHQQLMASMCNHHLWWSWTINVLRPFLILFLVFASIEKLTFLKIRNAQKEGYSVTKMDKKI